VLLVGLPTLLADILEAAIADAEDLALAGRTDDLSGVDERISRAQVNVIIMDLEGDRLPSVAGELIRRHPQICVLSISSDGRSLFSLELRPVVRSHGEASVARVMTLLRETVARERVRCDG
jgi:hypothetical protein